MTDSNVTLRVRDKNGRFHSFPKPAIDALRVCISCKRTLRMDSFGFDGRRYKSHCKECDRVKFRIREALGKRIEKRKKKAPGRYAPIKVKAKNFLKNAVTKGLVERKPCEVCGNPKSEGHHSDYSKPLEVRWLCRKHHQETHRKPVAPEVLAAFGGSNEQRT